MVISVSLFRIGCQSATDNEISLTTDLNSSVRSFKNSELDCLSISIRKAVSEKWKTLSKQMHFSESEKILTSSLSSKENTIDENYFTTAIRNVIKDKKWDNIHYTIRIKNATAKTKRLMKILICEDEEIMLTALEFRLRKQGFQVIKAEDGLQAKAKLISEEPDLVIADIMMPHVSGLELIQYIRLDLKKDLPVSFISALEYEDVILEAFRLGANDFITKPFKPYELILRIRKIFQEMGVLEE